MHEGQLFKTCTDSQPLAGSGARPLSFIATRAPHIVVDRINFNISNYYLDFFTSYRLR